MITKNETRRQWNVDFRTINRIIFIGIFACGFGYIASVNELATKGFTLNGLKKNYNELRDENFRLQARVTSLDSYSGLAEKIRGAGMVGAGKIVYVDPNNPVMARK